MHDADADIIDAGRRIRKIIGWRYGLECSKDGHLELVGEFSKKLVFFGLLQNVARTVPLSWLLEEDLQL